MLSSLIHPWAILVGLSCLAIPVIIHLFNRIRYKKIRWAAIEFLLKAQKRTRRKLIIEQIILLLLRILLILLISILAARFLDQDISSSDAPPTEDTINLVIIDDTPSMSDSGFNSSGVRQSAFIQAKDMVKSKILQAFANSTKRHRIILLKFSDFDNPYPSSQGILINNSSVDNLLNWVETQSISFRHVALSKVLTTARNLLSSFPNHPKQIHLISDFRSSDWSGNTNLLSCDICNHFIREQVKVFFYDSAFPLRNLSQNLPSYSENLAILDLRPLSRFAAVDSQFEFEITIANFSSVEYRPLHIKIYIDGKEDPSASTLIPRLPQKQTVREIFYVRLSRKIDTSNLTTNPLSPSNLSHLINTRFSTVTSVIQCHSDGLQIDNFRSIVLELVERAKVLVIDPQPENKGLSESSDSYNIRSFFSSLASDRVAVHIEGVNYLESTFLPQYRSVFLMNIPFISDSAIRNLHNFINNGGGVCFFLGDNLMQKRNREFYNERLFLNGDGIFPCRFQPEPDPAREISLPESGILEDKALFVKAPSHSLFRKIYTENSNDGRPHPFDVLLRSAEIYIHVSLARSLDWLNDSRVNELIVMPSRSLTDLNIESIRSFFQSFHKVFLMDHSKSPNVTIDKDKLELLFSFKSFIESSVNDALSTGVSPTRILGLLREFRYGGSSNPLFNSDEFNEFLRDFWRQIPLLSYAADIDRLIFDLSTSGDPILVSKEFPRGRVLLCTTSGNSKWWNDSGATHRFFPILLSAMENWLSQSASLSSRTPGEQLDIVLPTNIFSDQVQRFHILPDFIRNQLREAGFSTLPAVDFSGISFLGSEILHRLDDHNFIIQYNDSFNRNLPRFDGIGSILFSFRTSGSSSTTNPLSDSFFSVIDFNNDSVNEGDLRRIDRDSLTRNLVPGSVLLTPTTDSTEYLSDQRHDLSESILFMLIILLILTFEQFVSIRLSYHQLTRN